MDSNPSDRWVPNAPASLGPRTGNLSLGPGVMGNPSTMYGAPQSGMAAPIGSLNLGLSGNAPFVADRFDAYKQTVPLRRYWEVCARKSLLHNNIVLQAHHAGSKCSIVWHIDFNMPDKVLTIPTKHDVKWWDIYLFPTRLCLKFEAILYTTLSILFIAMFTWKHLRKGNTLTLMFNQFCAFFLSC